VKNVGGKIFSKTQRNAEEVEISVERFETSIVCQWKMAQLSI